MSLEEKIVSWASGRPSWQKTILRYAAEGRELTDKEYEELIDALVAQADWTELALEVQHLPSSAEAKATVALSSISDPEHVNALSTEVPLTFGSGLTIVYGDNGSGKSGYARILKRIARARHNEAILSDVFEDTAAETPASTITATIDGEESTVKWPTENRPELRNMLFYDSASGAAYIDTESNFPYRPAALFAMDGLIRACEKVRERTQERLDENLGKRKELPEPGEACRNCKPAQFLRMLNGRSSVARLDAFIAKLESAPSTIEELLAREEQLRSTDPSKERSRLTRQAAKVESIVKHIRGLEEVLGTEGVASLETLRTRRATIEESAAASALAFDSEALQGIGTDVWKELWESARRYSEQHAYPERDFPVVDGVCVLCLQGLSEDASARLSSFESFVKEDLQQQLTQANSEWTSSTETLRAVECLTEAVEAILTDLADDHAPLVTRVRTFLQESANEHAALVEVLTDNAPLPESSVTLGTLETDLERAAADVRETALKLGDAEEARKELEKVKAQRQELELVQAMKDSRDDIVFEIERRGEYANLEGVFNSAATGPITKKIVQLSRDEVSEVVRDRFTRESDRLQLERVTMAPTRAEKGALLHQPQLLAARQTVELPQVFSEGEQTALGLAGYFTEAELEASKSALILDDPVSSLDHRQRERVAARLVTFAESRQVIVFTHDVSLVADLKLEARGKGVDVAERSVVRSRAVNGRPGACRSQHPWKAKDVRQRLGELEKDLARIEKEAASWEEREYEKEVSAWAGSLSETWERVFSQELVGQVLAEGGQEVRPQMVRVLAKFSDDDYREFDASYGRCSKWAKRHDKSTKTNYVPPTVKELKDELAKVRAWFDRVRKYKS